MENALNISSEEELLQLRDEGKISEVEYNDLLCVIRKSMPSELEEPVSSLDEVGSKRKLGKIAFYLLLAGFILPGIGFFFSSAASGWGEMDVIFDACFFACVLIQLLAFVFGVVSWPDVFGKATIATILALATIWTLYHVLRILALLSTR
jgi:hypothetical protein